MMMSAIKGQLPGETLSKLLLVKRCRLCCFFLSILVLMLDAADSGLTASRYVWNFEACPKGQERKTQYVFIILLVVDS